MRIDIWSDLVCPWCYLGKRRFETALAAAPDPAQMSVVHRAFQLDPSMPKGTTVRHRDVLVRKYGLSESQLAASQARLERLAADEGLEYRLAELETGNTMDAHRVVRLALEQGRQDIAIERLFRAHFTEGRSLFDHASLLALAEDAGIADARALLDGNRLTEEVAADHREANALGISGVPFFLIDGRFGVSGAQSADVFAAALARASQEHR